LSNGALAVSGYMVTWLHGYIVKLLNREMGEIGCGAGRFGVRPACPPTPRDELNVSHIFAAGHRGREISLKATLVSTTPMEHETVQRRYASARQGDRK